MAVFDNRSIPQGLPLENKVINTTGATADIIRQTYSDGRSAIVKRAKEGFDKELQHEFGALLIMEDNPYVPRVYDDLPTRGPQEHYAFRMEDLSGYSSLYDRQTGHNNCEHLSVLDRVVIVDQFVKAIRYANSKGIINGDLQMDNLMFRHENKVELKVIDWGAAQRMTPQNEVNQNFDQEVAVVHQIFFGTSRIPRDVEGWIDQSSSGKFKSAEDAWSTFETAKQNYLQNDFKDSDVDPI